MFFNKKYFFKKNMFLMCFLFTNDSNTDAKSTKYIIIDSMYKIV